MAKVIRMYLLGYEPSPLTADEREALIKGSDICGLRETALPIGTRIRIPDLDLALDATEGLRGVWACIGWEYGGKIAILTSQEAN